MKRIWNVRLNLDEFNSALAGLDSDVERLAFLSGLNAGLNGKFNMGKGAPWEAGWSVGNTSHVEAIAFSDRQRANVSKRYQTSTTVEPRKIHGTSTELPNDNRQSTIQESKNPRTTCARDEHDIGAQPDAQPPVDEVDRWRYLQNEPWAKALVKAGCKIGPKNWSRWQALAVAHGHERVAAVAMTCLATKRWPDETETALLKSCGQAPITQSIQHRIRSIA